MDRGGSPYAVEGITPAAAAPFLGNRPSRDQITALPPPGVHRDIDGGGLVRDLLSGEANGRRVPALVDRRMT
jgi:hypothetical protein